MAAPVGRLMAKFRVKSPAELVQRTHQALVRLPYESQPERTAEELGRLLAALKECMFGDVEEHASRENALAVAREACATGLVSELVDALGLLDFEARKDAADVFCGVMRVGDADGGRPGAAYLEAHPGVVPTLLDGYDRAEVALNCGAMLREAARHEAVAGRLLGDLLDDLLARAQSPEFEVAADAFATLKDALTRHRALAAARLADPGAGVLARYRALLESRDYVTRRQAARLLGQLLCDRANVKAMMLYVSDADNLKLAMNLLRDDSRSIAFEAFHVFKVFVANPNKAPAVAAVLAANREKLLRYLETFQADREDEQFQEEKGVIAREIAELEAPGGAGGGEGA